MGSLEKWLKDDAAVLYKNKVGEGWLSEEEELGDDRDERRYGYLVEQRVYERKLPGAGWCGNAIIACGFPAFPFL
jgi:hypothetical protein